jgi:hypothetical protein
LLQRDGNTPDLYLSVVRMTFGMKRTEIRTRQRMLIAKENPKIQFSLD